MHLYYEDFVHPQVINIFSDASMNMIGNNVAKAGCYGFVTYCGEQELNHGVFIDSMNTTVNRCEVKGLKKAICEAIRLRLDGFTGMINIFCDSQVALLGLRDWVFNWKVSGDTLINKSGIPVSNQSEYIEIIRLIIKYNPNVNLYHQKGHVSPNAQGKNSYDYARKLFSDVNIPYVKPKDIDMRIIAYISNKNDRIDYLTRWHLFNTACYNVNYTDPFIFTIGPEFQREIHTYNMVTGRRNHNV